jgi:hypothetical protein
VREAGRNASSNFNASIDASLKTNRVLTEFERTNKTALDNAADSARRAAEETGQAVKEGAQDVEEGAKDAANEIGRGLDRTGEEIQKEADRAK